MQTLNWYYRRLKIMSPDEVAWPEQIADNHFDLFDLSELYLGDLINWRGYHKRRQAVGNAFTNLLNKRIICARRKS